MLLFAGFVCVLVFVRGLWSVPKTLTAAPADQFELIEPGQTVLLRQGAKNIWVTRFNQPLQAFYRTNRAMLLATPSACGPDRRLCIIDAQTSRAGVLLRHVVTRPQQLGPDQPWMSGLVDPATGAVYDLFGRCYQTSGCQQGLAGESM